MKKILLKSIIITIIFEIIIFNFTTYTSFVRTIGKEKKEYVVGDLTSWVGDDNRTIFEIRDINSEVATVKVEFDEEFVKNPLDYNLAYSDETSEELRYLNQSKVYTPLLKSTEYMSTHFTGKVKSLDVNVDHDSFDYVAIKCVKINEIIPIDIVIPRIIVVFLIVFFVSFIKNHEVFKEKFDKKNFKQELILIMLLYITFFLLFSLLMMTMSNEGEELEFYTKEFIDALNNKQVHLDLDVSDELLGLENPYDQLSRDKQIQRDEEYNWDTAYYNGKYYMYFGILPALTLLLPFYKITGIYMISNFAILIYELLSLILLKSILEKTINLLFKDKKIEFKIVFFMHLILYFGTMFFYIMGIPRMYELVIVAGVYAVLQGVWFLFKTFEKEKVNFIYLFFASLFMAASIAARPTQIFMSVVIAVVGIKLLIKYIKDKNVKDIIKLVLSIGIPYITVAALLMYYNYIRFGNVLEFGASYQLTVNNMDILKVGPAAGMKALFVNLFNIPTFTMDFPFLINNSNVISHHGYYYYESLVGGIFFFVPLLFILFDIFKFNKNKGIEKNIKIIVNSLLVLAVCILFTNSIVGGCIGRYLVDAMWLFVLASEIMFLTKYTLLKSDESKIIYKKILKWISVYVIIFAVLTGIVSEKSRFFENSPNEYFAFKYSISFWE